MVNGGKFKYKSVLWREGLGGSIILNIIRFNAVVELVLIDLVSLDMMEITAKPLRLISVSV